jgi:hypothetical protein
MFGTFLTLSLNLMHSVFSGTSLPVNEGCSTKNLAINV